MLYLTSISFLLYCIIGLPACGLFFGYKSTTAGDTIPKPTPTVFPFFCEVNPSASVDNCLLTAKLDFTPSNISKDVKITNGDVVFSRIDCESKCIINTDTGKLDGLRSSLKPHFEITEQTTISATGTVQKLAVFGAKKITIEEGAVLRFVGSNIPVLLALESIENRGTILVNGENIQGNAGGFSSPPSRHSAGVGPGGPSATVANSNNVGAGASYCGMGGVGSNLDIDISKSTPKQPYGNATLTPLLAGSSGSSAVGKSGAGGGAIYLLSNQIRLYPTSIIHAGGGGAESACWGSPGGGGSGGAILIEGKTVIVEGTLAANGGAGTLGCKGKGRDATPDINPADGATDNSIDFGNRVAGSGGAGIFKEGKNGSATLTGYHGSYGGSGGGGVGRIRVNSQNITTAISASAVVSPAISTGCITVGTIN